MSARIDASGVVASRLRQRVSCSQRAPFGSAPNDNRLGPALAFNRWPFSPFRVFFPRSRTGVFRGCHDGGAHDAARQAEQLARDLTNVGHGDRQTQKRIPDVARELGVDAVIEGSVLREGSRVKVTAQLIDGRTDRHIWADTFEREIESVLAIQNDVARAIARAVDVTLTPEGDRGLTSATRPVLPAAYARTFAAAMRGTKEAKPIYGRRFVCSSNQSMPIQPTLRLMPDWPTATHSSAMDPTSHLRTRSPARVLRRCELWNSIPHSPRRMRH